MVKCYCASCKTAANKKDSAAKRAIEQFEKMATADLSLAEKPASVIDTLAGIKTSNIIEGTTKNFPEK